MHRARVESTALSLYVIDYTHNSSIAPVYSHRPCPLQLVHPSSDLASDKIELWNEAALRGPDAQSVSGELPEIKKKDVQRSPRLLRADAMFTCIALHCGTQLRQPPDFTD